MALFGGADIFANKSSSRKVSVFILISTRFRINVKLVKRILYIAAGQSANGI